MTSSPPPKPRTADEADTLRAAFADSLDFVASFVADDREGSPRTRFAQKMVGAARVVRSAPSPDEAADAWDASPLGRLERKLRERGIIRDRAVSAEHLRGSRGKGDDR